MKRLVAFILLLCHMNTSMFLPQMAEEDVYDANGNQVDDINSVVEYIRVSLGYDHTADDEDDDAGQNFHLAKSLDYVYEQPVVILQKEELLQTGSRKFPEYIINSVDTISFEIITPPPETIPA